MPRAVHDKPNLSAVDIAERREIVWMLKGQGMKPYAILKFLRDNQELCRLIENYANPYQTIMGDLKKPPHFRMRQEVTQEDTQFALAEATARLDEQYAALWDAAEKLQGTPTAVYVQLMQQLEVITLTRAKLLGVAPEPHKLINTSEPGSLNFNFLGADPAQFLSQVNMARKMLNANDEPRDVTPLSITAGGDDSDST